MNNIVSIFLIILSLLTGCLSQIDSSKVSQQSAATQTSLPSSNIQKGGIVICKVLYNPSGKEPDNEMITLCNKGNSGVDVSGWILSDGEGTYRIPSGTIIPGGGSWSVFGYTYNPSRNMKGLYLGNDGDEVLLYDSNRNLIDEYHW